MIELIATAESLEQGKQLIDAGVNKVIMGEENFALRIPGHLTFEEMSKLTGHAHQKGAQTVVAANAILHNDKIKQAPEFIRQVKAIGADLMLVGDTGLIQIMKQPEYSMPFIYDAAVLVTSPGQVNFWARYGAVASLVAREVPFYELKVMAAQSQIPLLYQVYGATCIHHSKRNLLTNYFNYTQREPSQFKDRHLFLSEPNKPHTHYSIFEDDHGTHVFANNDLNLLAYLGDLAESDIHHWYLDGIYTPGDKYVEVVKIFMKAKHLIETDQWQEEKIAHLNQELEQWHPENRRMDTGFFLHEPGTVK